MRRAACLIRDLPHYRSFAFLRGLRACGFEVSADAAPRPRAGDVLVIWNRYSRFDSAARAYQAAGGVVMVVENGYVGADKEGRHLFAISRWHHNGAGEWEEGAEDRWSPLGIELKPWRTGGSFILLLPQRGIGEPGVAMPLTWPGSAYSRLEQMSGREIRIRKHPGKEPHPPLEPDFVDCFAVVTWGSGAAIRAIVAGIPVFYEFPKWIGAPAARQGLDHLEEPFLGDRLPMLKRLAWAQWSAAEIERGDPFRCLLK